MKKREPGDYFTQTAVGQMKDVDSMVGSLSAALGGIASVSLLAGGLYPTLKAAGAEPIETLRYE